MKRQLTTVITGTMLAIAGAIMPASATVPNTTVQLVTDAVNQLLLTLAECSEPSCLEEEVIARFRKRGPWA